MNIPPPPPKPVVLCPSIGRAVIAEPTLDAICQAEAWRRRHAKRIEFQRHLRALRNPNVWTRLSA